MVLFWFGTYLVALAHIRDKRSDMVPDAALNRTSFITTILLDSQLTTPCRNYNQERLAMACAHMLSGVVHQ